MKELTLEKMEILEGGDWKDFVDGACIVGAWVPQTAAAGKFIKQSKLVEDTEE